MSTPNYKMSTTETPTSNTENTVKTDTEEMSTPHYDIRTSEAFSTENRPNLEVLNSLNTLLVIAIPVAVLIVLIILIIALKYFKKKVGFS